MVQRVAELRFGRPLVGRGHQAALVEQGKRRPVDPRAVKGQVRVVRARDAPPPAAHAGRPGLISLVGRRRGVG